MLAEEASRLNRSATAEQVKVELNHFDANLSQLQRWWRLPHAPRASPPWRPLLQGAERSASSEELRPPARR